MKPTVKKAVGLGLRLAVAGAIVVYLLRRMGPASLVGSLHTALGHWPWLLAALGMLLVPLVLCGVRWQLLLRSQGMALSWPRMFAIFFVGHFFNTFMLGATGGDVVKAYYASRETQHRKTEAVATILVDRAVGIFMLVLLAAVLVLTRVPFLRAYPVTYAPALFILVVAAGLVALAVLLFRRHLFEQWPWLGRDRPGTRWGAWLVTFRRGYDAFYTVRNRPGLLARICLLTLLNHTWSLTACIYIGIALGLHFALLDYVTFFLLIGVIAAIPITPGGLGLREGTAVHLLAVLGIGADKAFLAAFLPYVGFVIWGLLGGVVFLFYTSSTHHTLHAEMEQLRAEGQAPGS